MFKVKNSAISLGQEVIKIPTRLGTSFTENNIIRFEIPRGVGFADLQNSYLEATIRIGNDSNSTTQADAQPCMMLDPIAGANNIIDRLTIRTLNGGRVIEELASYDVYANLHHSATSSEGTLNKRSIMEGCAKSLLIQDNPYCTNNTAIVPVVAPVTAGETGTGIVGGKDRGWKYVDRKVCLPLLGGVFSTKESFPLFELGLEVEIILNSALKILRVVESRVGTNLDQMDCDDAPQGQAERDLVIVSGRALFNSMGGATANGLVDPNTSVQGEQPISSICNLPLRPGQVIRLSAGGGAGIADFTAGNYTIKKIDQFTNGSAAGRENKLAVWLTTNVFANPRTGDVTGIAIHQLDANGGLLTEHGQAGYSVNNPRLVIQKVIPPSSVAQAVANGVKRGQYSINLNSYVLVNTSIPASQTTSTNIIAVDLSRAKSILSVPTSQDNNDSLLVGNALQGLYLNADKYIYNIKNKFRPDRHIQLAREQFPATLRTTGTDEVSRPYKMGQHAEGFHAFEVEKALLSAGIDLKDLSFLTRNNGTDNQFQAVERGCWFVGRTLSSNANTSTNIMGQSVLLYLDYRNDSNMVKLVHHFVVHNRSILFEGMDGVAISY